MAVYSVSEVTTYLRGVIETDSLLQDVWVAGEVANLSRAISGHSYFTLREGGSSLRCVMFRNAVGAERLANGAAVISHGRASIYEVRGDLQLIVDLVQPEGVGELGLRLEQLKLKLSNEGLFEPSRKRRLPPYPKNIAVVTSPSGAVWHDIKAVITRRYPLVRLLLAPTPVQGALAAPGIVDAFRVIGALPQIDLVIAARGGGSLEDLWAFNEEVVARAIYACSSPVISAVGHETDVTIADLVADHRAPTPSAAAEMCVPDKSDLGDAILAAEQAIFASASRHLSARGGAVRTLVGRAQRSSPDLESLRIRIDDLLREGVGRIKKNVEFAEQKVEGLRLRLESLSPADTLRRGYAIVQRQNTGSLVYNADQVTPGDTISVTVNRGAFEASVTKFQGNRAHQAPIR